MKCLKIVISDSQTGILYFLDLGTGVVGKKKKEKWPRCSAAENMI